MTRDLLYRKLRWRHFNESGHWRGQDSQWRMTNLEGYPVSRDNTRK
jgi:hypothetical protein